MYFLVALAVALNAAFVVVSASEPIVLSITLGDSTESGQTVFKINGVERPVLDLVKGQAYKFIYEEDAAIRGDYTDSSVGGHPFIVHQDLNGGSSMVVVLDTNTVQQEYTINDDGLYEYWCLNHEGMGNNINLLCPAGRTYWLQPQHQNYQDAHGLTDGRYLSSTFTNVPTAMCYPVAAASLLAKLRYDGDWMAPAGDFGTGSGGLPYPPSREVGATGDAGFAWFDYGYHTQSDMSLYDYMKTNQGVVGTTFANGEQGIRDFVSAKDPTKRAVVERVAGAGVTKTALKTAVYPLLLHIDTAYLPSSDCIRGDSGSADDCQDARIYLDYSASNDEEFYGTPGNSDLGHTVVVYGAEDCTQTDMGATNWGTDNSACLKLEVAMNVPAHGNQKGFDCTPSILYVGRGDSVFNTAGLSFTTVSIVDSGSGSGSGSDSGSDSGSGSDSDLGMPVWAIVFVAVGAAGGAVLLVLGARRLLARARARVGVPVGRLVF